MNIEKGFEFENFLDEFYRKWIRYGCIYDANYDNSITSVDEVECRLS